MYTLQNRFVMLSQRVTEKFKYWKAQHTLDLDLYIALYVCTKRRSTRCTLPVQYGELYLHWKSGRKRSQCTVSIITHVQFTISVFIKYVLIDCM